MAEKSGLHVYDGQAFAQVIESAMEPGPVKGKRTAGARPGAKSASGFGLRLRKAMAQAGQGSTGADAGEASDMMVVVVETPDRTVRETIRDIVEHVPSLIEARQGRLTDEAIDALVSVYMRAPVNTEVERLLYDGNARARARFLAEWPCHTSKDLAEAAGHGSKNRSMTASRWKAKGRVFSVRQGGADYFPAFQFQDGQPVEAVGRVIALLGGRKSPWQLAFWFTAPNGWLDGRRPADLLADTEAVVAAAAHEAEDIIG